MMRRASSLASTTSLAVSLLALLPGCGLLTDQPGPEKVELSGLLSVKVGESEVSPWGLLERGICGSTHCALRVPSTFAGQPEALDIAPVAETSERFCDAAPTTAFLGKTCRSDYANEVGFSLCIPGDNGGFGPGPCAVEATEWGAEHYLESLMTFGAAVVVRARQAAPNAPASPGGVPVASGRWPAGPAKVCVAVRPNRGVASFGFRVEMHHASGVRPVPGPGGTPPGPLCVALEIPTGTTAIVVNTTGIPAGLGAIGTSSSCLHTFTSPTDSTSIPTCTGFFAPTAGAVVGVAADTASRFAQTEQELVAWLNAKAQ